MFKEVELPEVLAFVEAKKDFVLNIVAGWCPDCTENQAPNLPEFAAQLEAVQLPLYNLLAQQEKRVYLTQELEEFVETLGGHGFPRTVLFKNGEVIDANNVEYMTSEQLQELVRRFSQN